MSKHVKCFPTTTMPGEWVARLVGGPVGGVFVGDWVGRSAFLEVGSVCRWVGRWLFFGGRISRLAFLEGSVGWFIFWWVEQMVSGDRVGRLFFRFGEWVVYVFF